MPDHSAASPPFPVDPDSLPSNRSYWVVLGQLAAGKYPSEADPQAAERALRRLVKCGFDFLVNLVEERESDEGPRLRRYADDVCRYAQEANRTVTCVRLPIQDQSVPTIEAMREILNTIDAAIADGRQVYVHCWGGIGRTGTVVGCYLVRHRLAVGSEALDRIRALRHTDSDTRRSPENAEQDAFVLAWRPEQ